MVARLIQFVTAAPSLRMLGIVGLIGWVIGFAAWTVRLPATTFDGKEAVGGDLISFYTGGRLILNGRGAALYDLRLQYDTQHAIIGNPAAESLCSYVNPPLLAIVMAPLALLPLKAAFVGYSLLAFAAFYFALRWLRMELTVVREHWPTALGVGFLFPPFCISITGGQNTAISLFLICGLFHFLRRGNWMLAGLLLGLLSYKPQLGVLIGVLLLVRGEVRVAAVAAVVAVGHYVIGAAVCGWDWPSAMLQTLDRYWTLEHEHNGYKSIALLGVCQFVLPAETWKPIGLGLIGGLVILIGWLWRVTPIRSERFPVVFAAAIAVVLFASPHTVWYDAGLLLPAGLILLDERMKSPAPVPAPGRLLLIAAFLLPGLFSFGKTLGWQPVALLPLGILIWAAFQLAPRMPEGHPAAPPLSI